MVAVNRASLPLHCNVCPKKPNFSDVSHLLTHIASKGHLSHCYNLRIRASHDETARETLDIYDRWYADYNVEQLMAERLHMKEQKRPRARGQAQNQQKKQTSVSSLDPRLSDLAQRTLEREISTQSNVFPSILESAPLDLPAPKPRKPHLHLWSTKQPETWRATQIEFSSSPPLMPYFNIENYWQPVPLAPMAQGSAAVDLDDDDTSTEATKLKGVLWPGMDIFDAATPGMRKKRNQKKDVSVAEQLERHSLFVEPTEVIFTPFGSLKKSRLITGQVESSPDQLSETSPKPRKSNTSRSALSLKNPNLPSRSSRALLFPPFPPYAPLNANVERQRPSKRKRTFSVFQDGAADDDDVFGHPSDLTYLNSEFHPSFRPNHKDSSARPSAQMSPSRQLFTEMFESVPSQTLSFTHDSGAQELQDGYDIADLLTQHIANADRNLAGETGTTKLYDTDPRTISTGSEE